MSDNNNFFSGRGTVYFVSQSKSSKYKLDPGLPKGNESSACIITGYSISETEITSRIACLNDQRVMYSFGKAFGDIQVAGEMLLGEAGKDQNAPIESELLDFYDANRVSKLNEAIKFSGGANLTMDFFLVGLQVAGYNTELEILPFKLIGVLAK